MAKFLTVVPAYGRDYKSAKAARADWKANLDFEVTSLFHGGGKYINKADADREGLTIILRYKRLQMLCKAEG